MPASDPDRSPHRQAAGPGEDQQARVLPFRPGASPDTGPALAPGRALLALARDLSQRLADRAQAARPSGSEPVAGAELGAWLRAQRQARGWGAREMARRLTAAGRAAGDTAMPGIDGMCHNIHRWEHHGGVSERHKLHYCRALGISPGQFGPGQPAGLAALPATIGALLTRWLEPPATPPDEETGTSNPPAPASHRPGDLDALRITWGDLYDITAAAARFRARRRDGTGPVLAADTPAQLNTAIRADWASTPAPVPGSSLPRQRQR